MSVMHDVAIAFLMLHCGRIFATKYAYCRARGFPQDLPRGPASVPKENSMIGKKVPNVTFRTRVRDEAIGGPNPFRWQDVETSDYFGGKRVVLFSLPGAFTPTCSTFQLPDFEKLHAEFKAEGI